MANGMHKTLTRKALIGGLALLAAAVYGYHHQPAGWETIATALGKGDKPYGSGIFRVRGNDIISLKVVEPELKFKPGSELKDPDVAEFTEPWMDDSSERLNRRTIAFLVGSLDTGLTRTFQQHGQNAAWWYSKDWRTLFVSTGWVDFKAPLPADGLPAQATKLWRSSDGGRSWKQLSWPEDRNIGRLLFLDPQRGYAIGWGPHVWRTTDGGQSWLEIKAPSPADFEKRRATFDAADLGPDGALRVARYVERSGEVKRSSLIYLLAWGQSEFDRDTVLPDQTVVDLQTSRASTDGGYSVYALTRLGLPRNVDNAGDNGHRTGAVSVWSNGLAATVRQLHTFDDHLMLDGLSVGNDGVMLVYATDPTSAGAPRDLTFLSKDFGESWKELEDGSAQGEYFDPELNTEYALFGYTLKKRRF